LEIPDDLWWLAKLSVPWILGILSSGLKKPVFVADQSPPSIAEVKNGGVIPTLPNMPSWRGWCLLN
jgi:hypothetical protein